MINRTLAIDLARTAADPRSSHACRDQARRRLAIDVLDVCTREGWRYGLPCGGHTPSLTRAVREWARLES